MGKTESTHEVAEKTDAAGKTTRTETRRETSESGETRTTKTESGGEPSQVQPDGR